MADICRFEERLQRIRRRLGELQCSGRFMQDFGVREHEFKLAAPLSDEEVSSFERRCELALPEDFRLFVTKLGAGGAGPYYGILPMSRWNEIGQTLCRPCPLTPELLEDPSWTDQMRLGPQEHPYQGLLTVSDCGCGYYCTLVVCGPARGRICYVYEGLNQEPPYFTEDDGFLSWYERWLHELEAGFDLCYFGFGAKGSDEEVCEILAGSESSQRRVEAAFALAKRPALGKPVVDTLLQAVRSDASNQVRAQAVRALRTVGSPETLAALKTALADPETAVKVAALWVLCRHREQGLGIEDDLFVRQLESAEPEVARHAVYGLLRRKGGPYHPELAQLLRRPEAELRSLAVWALGHWGCKEGIEALRQALADPERDVRICAGHVLRKLGIHETDGSSS